MNVRFDDVVHAASDQLDAGGMPLVPLCGNAMMPACAPELTCDPVDCWECESLIS